jgi:hypothetical protein
MADYTPSLRQKEQRKKVRLHTRESMDPKVTIWAQNSLYDGAQNVTPTESWEGYLRNICSRGVQVIFKANWCGQLRKHQRVKLQFDNCSTKAEVIGRLVYIAPDKEACNVKLGIEFIEYELDPDAKWAINRICEDAVPCAEFRFDGAPGL